MDIDAEISRLERMTIGALRARYLELFAEAARSNNKTWLVRRIAWRLQALAEGDLSERARRRATELANDADLRIRPPRPPHLAHDGAVIRPTPRSNGTPAPGTVLTRVYKGETLYVNVLADGFEHAGQRYASLSAVAKAITGSHTSGFLFFGIQKGAQV